MTANPLTEYALKLIDRKGKLVLNQALPKGHLSLIMAATSLMLH